MIVPVVVAVNGPPEIPLPVLIVAGVRSTQLVPSYLSISPLETPVTFVSTILFNSVENGAKIEIAIPKYYD